jgi:UPF0755 protein
MTPSPPGSAAQNRNKIWLRGGIVRHFMRLFGYILLIPVSLVISTIFFLIYAVAWFLHAVTDRMRSRRSLTESAALMFTALAVLLGLTLFGPPAPGTPEERTMVVVLEKGLGVREIASRLKGANVISSPGQFLLLSKLLGVEYALQAGKYAFPANARPLDILNRLAKGQVTAQMVTIPEGMTIRQMAILLERESGIDAGRFSALANDPHVAREHGFDALSLEGYLFPDTYGLYWDLPAENIIDLLSHRFQQIYDRNMQHRARELGMSRHEVITLASMIEEEAQVPEERPLISAVFHNRLRQKMLLQCDPTVIYALGEKDTPLTREDLQVDSPYNTYRRHGLPPGPISNPGQAAILAALYPAEVDYLYFVARGDGSHQFSRTSREHINAIHRIKNSLGG